MVEFGLKLEDNKVHAWREHYVRYEKLKGIVDKACKNEEKYLAVVSKLTPDVASAINVLYQHQSHSHSHGHRNRNHASSSKEEKEVPEQPQPQQPPTLELGMDIELEPPPTHQNNKPGLVSTVSNLTLPIEPQSQPPQQEKAEETCSISTTAEMIPTTTQHAPLHSQPPPPPPQPQPQPVQYSTTSYGSIQPNSGSRHNSHSSMSSSSIHSTERTTHRTVSQTTTTTTNQHNDTPPPDEEEQEEEEVPPALELESERVVPPLPQPTHAHASTSTLPTSTSTTSLLSLVTTGVSEFWENQYKKQVREALVQRAHISHAFAAVLYEDVHTVNDFYTKIMTELQGQLNLLQESVAISFFHYQPPASLSSSSSSILRTSTTSPFPSPSPSLRTTTEAPSTPPPPPPPPPPSPPSGEPAATSLLMTPSSSASSSALLVLPKEVMSLMDTPLITHHHKSSRMSSSNSDNDPDHPPHTTLRLVAASPVLDWAVRKSRGAVQRWSLPSWTLSRRSNTTSTRTSTRNRSTTTTSTSRNRNHRTVLSEQKPLLPTGEDEEYEDILEEEAEEEENNDYEEEEEMVDLESNHRMNNDNNNNNRRPSTRSLSNTMSLSSSSSSTLQAHSKELRKSKSKSMTDKEDEEDNDNNNDIDPEKKLRPNNAAHAASLRSQKIREAESVQRSLAELYRRAKLLHNYSIMNYTAFVKIVKKHDKVMKHEKGKFRSTIDPANICRGGGQDVERLADQMEVLYANWFCSKNIMAARAQLLSKKGDGLEMDWSQLRLGYRMGMCSVLALWVCWDCIWGTISQGRSTIGGRTAFPVFRACGGVLLLQWFWGCSVWVWTRFRINYIYLFDLNPQTVSTPLGIFNEAVDHSLFFLTSMLLYYKAGANDLPIDFPAGMVPFVLVLYTLWHLFMPWKRAREPMWSAIGLVLSSPMTSPTFFHGYIGDIFTSMVKVFQDWAWTIGFLLSGDFLIPEEKASSTKHHWAKTVWYSQILIPILTLFPLWLRFNQCLRRYTDTRKRMPHLANAAKYSLSMTVTLFGAFHPLYLHNATHQPTEWFQIFWMGAFVSSSLYSFFWDVVMDWGLGRVQYQLLGPRLMYPRRASYYLVMALDLVLRFAWVLTLVPPNSGANFALPQYLTAVSMLLELFRRTLWGFVRLENEHRSNTSGYRRVDFVPLHFSTEHARSHQQPNQDQQQQHRRGELPRKGIHVLIEVVIVTLVVLGASVASIVAAQHETDRLMMNQQPDTTSSTNGGYGGHGGNKGSEL